MSKKNAITLDVRNDGQRNMMFTQCFLPALRRNTISVSGNMLCMETEDEKYLVNLYDFAFVWNPSFEHIFGEDVPFMMREDNVNTGSIKSLFEWSNPIFDKLPVKIKVKDKTFEDLKAKLKKDNNYYNIVRKATFDFINLIDIDKRKEYIDKFIEFGILKEEDKIILQYYASYSPEALEKVLEEKNMDKTDRVEIVSQAFVEERRKQALRKNADTITCNKKIVRLINLLDVDDILDVFLSGVLTKDEFAKTRVTKRDLLAVEYETLLDLLSNKNDLLPAHLRITSMDLVNQYGRNLNGSQIYKLANYGYIEPQDLIEVYEINKVLKHTNYDESIFEDEEIEAYYTPDILIKMKQDGKISPRFLQKYLEMSDFEKNAGVFKRKSELLAEELKKNSEDGGIEEDILYFFEIGLCDPSVAGMHISPGYIENKFINSEITIEKVLEYYKRGLIDDDSITKYYSPLDILELYESGTVNGSCLTVIRDTDILIGEFVEDKIALEDFFGLYLSGNLTVNDLDDAIQLSEREVDISSFIDENVPLSKIKELFFNYLIDYSLILRLHNQGIISDQELEEIKATVSTKKFFQDLKDGKKYKVITSRQNTGTQKGKTGVGKGKAEDDFSEEVKLISKLLGKDVENEPYSLIESYNANGRATSLNNYRIFGNEELDGIVILQKSKKENAVYVMSALQMLYFLKGKENNDGDIEIQNRMKDKAYLKTIEGVEVVEHTEHFARNLVEAASRISPKIAERTRSSDRKYVAEVEKMVESMREKYLETKAKDRNDD